MEIKSWRIHIIPPFCELYFSHLQKLYVTFFCFHTSNKFIINPQLRQSFKKRGSLLFWNHSWKGKVGNENPYNQCRGCIGENACFITKEITQLSSKIRVCGGQKDESKRNLALMTRIIYSMYSASVERPSCNKLW